MQDSFILSLTCFLSLITLVRINWSPDFLNWQNRCSGFLPGLLISCVIQGIDCLLLMTLTGTHCSVNFSRTDEKFVQSPSTVLLLWQERNFTGLGSPWVSSCIICLLLKDLLFRIYYRKQLRILSIVLESCKHASMNCHRSIAINLARQPNVIIILQSQSRLTMSKALTLSTKVMFRSIFCF